jgi:hypothetical protein
MKKSTFDDFPFDDPMVASGLSRALAILLWKISKEKTPSSPKSEENIIQQEVSTEKSAPGTNSNTRVE